MKKIAIFISFCFCLLQIPLTAQAESAPPFKLPAKNELTKIRSCVIQTNKGDIFFRLFPEDAPWHVANFKYLADSGFYRNLRFHMHERGYAIQAGAPGRRVNSGPGYTIPPEFNRKRHLPGTLSMVRKPDDLDVSRTRESHGSQFRIIFKKSPHMDGRFVVFGEIIKGFNIAKKLRKGDIIKNVIVYVQGPLPVPKIP